MADEKPAAPSTLKIFLAFLACSSLNIFLNFYNKWVLTADPDYTPPSHEKHSAVALLQTQLYTEVDLHALSDKAPATGAGFQFPIFYTMFHMWTSVIGSLVLMLIKRPETGMPSFKQLWEYKVGIAGLATCTVINLACNNASLTLVSLFLNLIIKAAGPLVGMIASNIVLKRTYSKAMVASVVVLAMSAALSVPYGEGSSTMIGILLALIATVASSTKPVVGELLMSEFSKLPKLTPVVLVFYDTFFAALIMMTLWLAIRSERVGSADYLKVRPAMGCLILAVGSSAAFAYNMSSYYFTMVASAVVMMVSTQLIKIVLMTASAVAEGVSLWYNWLGIFIFYVSVCTFAYLQYAEKQSKQKPQTVPQEGSADAAKSAASAGKPSERTPLTSA